jgi:hypothetical protein
VDDGADADRSAYPHAERGNHTYGKSRRALQAAKGEARVTGNVVECDHATRVARFLPEALRAAEAENGGPSRFGFAHAAANVLGRFHFQMKGKLLVHLGRQVRAAAEQLPDAGERGTHLVQHRSALRGEDETDGADESSPRSDFLTEGPSSGGGEPVVLGAPAVLCDAPFRVDPAPLLQPDESRVDGALAWL